MTKHISTHRPARAAIAAVLAFSATPLLAQVAAPPIAAPSVAAPTVQAPVEAPVQVPMAVAPPPVSAQPVTATNPPGAVPAFSASQPVVQSTPSVEARRSAALAAAEAENAQTARPAARAPAARAATPRSVAQAERAPVAATAERPTATAPTAAAAAIPVASAPARMSGEAMSGEAMSGGDQVPAPLAVADPSTGATDPADPALYWAIGGGALLIAGLAGAAMMRRRRDPATARTPILTSRDAPVDPVAAPAAVARFAAYPAQAQPAAFAPVSASVAPAGSLVSASSLEAMIAAPPSADNPFRTQRNRTRRARFLLAQREAGMNPAAQHRAPTTQEVAAVADRSQAADRSQMVYRFGPQAARPGFMKPRTG